MFNRIKNIGTRIKVENISSVIDEINDFRKSIANYISETDDYKIYKNLLKY